MPQGHPLCKTVQESLEKVKERAKYTQTAHMMRGLIRREKAVRFTRRKEFQQTVTHSKRDSMSNIKPEILQ